MTELWQRDAWELADDVRAAADRITQRLGGGGRPAGELSR